MSDSEEDFASADEGDVHPESAGVSKGQTEKSSTVTKKDAKENEKENKAVGKSESVKTEAKNDSQAEDSKETLNKEKNKAGPSKKESGKDGKSGTQDEKSKEKPKGGKGKKGKQRVGKSKTDHSVKEATGKDEGVDNKKTVGAKEIDACIGKETDNTSEDKSGESGECKDKERVDKDSKAETDSSQVLTSEENVKEIKAQPDADLIDKEASSGDSKENLTFEEKVALIKSPSSQSIIRPAPDHTDKEEAVLEKLAGAAQEKKGGWGWGWGSSLLEVASSSVSTFTSQVGEGLHTMMETVESTLNVPDPEELAQKVTKQTEASKEQDSDNKDGAPGDTEKPQIDKSSGFKNQPKSEETVKQTDQSESTETQSTEAEKKADNQSGDGWFSAWGVSNITKMVESTGKNLVTGSLDVLETLGKKTFDVINEHDPGLKKARAFLHDRGDKPNLSAMLRDAKEQYETQVELEKESEEARKAHFGSLFDDFQGLAHLEALEMLSNQSEKKVNVLLNALPAETIAKLKPQLLEIKQNFEIDEDEEEVTEQEFTLLVTDLLKELNVGTTPDKILKTYDGVEEKLKDCCDGESNSDVKEIHRVAISSLAEMTSKCIEQFHKAGELILIQKSTVSDFSSCSSALLRLTKVLTAEVGILSTKFSDCLNKHEGDEIKVSHLVTNIYLEASNSSSYIQDGFRLLLPVLQQAAIERSQEPED